MSGTWFDGNRWSSSPFAPNNGTPAGTNYSAVLGALGGAHTITLAVGNAVNVNSVALPSSAASLFLRGTLDTPALDLGAGRVVFSQGTLRNAAVTSSGGGTILLNDPQDVINLNQLENVTLGSGVVVVAGTSSVTRLSNVTFAGGTLLLGNSCEVVAQGATALAGMGTVIVAGPGARFGATPQPLNIPPGITISAGTVDFSIDQVSNRGTIYAVNAFGEVKVGGTNEGRLIAQDNGTIRIGNSLGPFTNTGTILIASGAALQMGVGTSPWTTTTGIFREPGAAIDISYTVDNTGATLDLGNTPLGPVGLGTNAWIDGGFLTSSAGAVRINRRSATLAHVTCDTDVEVQKDATLMIRGGLTLLGDRSISSVHRNIESTDTSTVVLDARFEPNYLRAQAGTLTIRDHMIVTTSQDGIGQPVEVGALAGGFVNAGSLLAQFNNATITVRAPHIENLGTFGARFQGTLSVPEPSSLGNLAGTTLTGGSWLAGENSSILLGNATISINDATINISVNGQFPALATLLENRGTLVLNAGTLAVAGDLLNTGTFAALPFGRLTVPAGRRLNNTGVLTGRSGTFDADIDSTGSILVGENGRAGLLTIDGELHLGGTSSLAFELAGTTTSSYDRLLVSGTLLADGAVRVATISNFAPKLGDTFDLFDAPLVSGTFTTVELPPLAQGLAWDSSLLSSGIIKVVPEPAAPAAVAFSVLAAPAAAVARGRRRRCRRRRD